MLKWDVPILLLGINVDYINITLQGNSQPPIPEADILVGFKYSKLLYKADNMT